MNFQDLKKVETANGYIDIAFRKATKTAEKVRLATKGSQLEKSKRIELEKISVIRDVLVSKLQQILDSFPDIDGLDEFYLELIKITIEHGKLKKSLGAVKWAIGKIDSFSKKFRDNIQKNSNITRINNYRREYYGRVSSVLKQIKEELKYIESSRHIMTDFPVIKTGLYTVAIAGFPNVGKSTLLGKLTTSQPEIKNYAFTTKKLNLGYSTINNHKVQFIDTPGTLDRLDKMNFIERIADLALKTVADYIIYVFDVTEPFPLSDQMKLFRKIKTRYKKNICVYVSKTDVVKKEDYEIIIQRYERVFTDSNELVEEITKKVKLIR